MFTSEMESMLAMLMLIPTMTGGPEGTKENLMSLKQNTKDDHMRPLFFESTFVSSVGSTCNDNVKFISS